MEKYIIECYVHSKIVKIIETTPGNVIKLATSLLLTYNKVKIEYE